MVERNPINTPSAPKAIGPYSQAVKSGSLVFISGQIPLDPKTMQLVGEDVVMQTHQVFKNLSAIAKASGGNLVDIVKMTIYLTNLDNFSKINEIMTSYFQEPYPARATIEVSALPKAALVEVEAILALEI